MSSLSDLIPLGAALLAAILAVLSRIDPDHVLSDPGMQDDVMAVFLAATALFSAIWMIRQKNQESGD